METRFNAWTRMAFLVLLLISGLQACKKSADPGPMRNFTPTGNVSTTSGVSSVKLQWAKSLYAGNISYSVQLSRDSQFNSVERYYRTDTAGLTVTDDSIPVRIKYYARIKALGASPDLDSRWLVSTGFMISGEQLLLPLRTLDLKETAVAFRWTRSTGISRLVLTPAAGSPLEIALGDHDVLTENSGQVQLIYGYKSVEGLAAGTAYTAELFAGTKSKGLLNFSTLAKTDFALVLSPGDDLAAAVVSAAPGSVIGLKPGTYTLNAPVTVLQKTVQLKAVSGNRNDTKVNFKEFTLKGTGAGIQFYGLDLNGGGTAYLINLTGAGADAEAAAFSSIVIENCLVHQTANCLIRGNRGAAGAQSITQISVKNSVLYDNGGSYDYFTLDKLRFQSLEITRSTLYGIGRSLISCPTVLPGSSVPEIFIDQCTLNNFGADGKYALLDANTNPVKFSFLNSILGNVPKPGSTVQAALIRAAAAGSQVTFANNNIFRAFTGAEPAVVLTLPAAAMSTLTADLGWTAATTDFTLPVTTPLRTAGTTSGPLGDPLWTY